MPEQLLLTEGATTEIDSKNQKNMREKAIC